MRPKIYLFGDSITEGSFDDGGWGANLASHFSRTADVVLRGYGGYNTRWALKIVERVFPAAESGGESPLAVAVFFGANDACLPDRCSAFQHVPILEYKQNLHSIFTFFKKMWPNTIVLFITPPPIDEEARLKYPFMGNPRVEPERTNENAGAYAKACVEVAEECGSPVIDIWTEMQKNPDWKKDYLDDGLHLTSKGNNVVFQELISKLKEQGLVVEKLPLDAPHYFEIDPNDPLKAFMQSNKSAKGNSSIICSDCDGNGAVQCSQCKGTGVNSVDHFNGQFKAGGLCWLCRGKRDILCGSCNGAGFLGSFMSTFDE